MNRRSARVGALAMLLFASCAHSEVAPQAQLPGAAAAGEEAYALDLKLQDAEAAFEMSSFSGRLVLLMVSLPSCEACAHLEPQLKNLAARLEKESLNVSYLTVLLERPDSEDSVQHGGEAPWAEPKLNAGQTKLGVIDTVPVTWVLSRSGVPILRYEGSGDEVVVQLEEDLRGYLKVERSF